MTTAKQKGKLAALQGFIKGKVESIASISHAKVTPEDQCAAESQEKDIDDEQEMKTFWFSQENKESSETKQDVSWLPGLTKKQRIIGFFTFLITGAFCFAVAGLLLPFLILKVRKFVLLYTMGSFFTIGSFSILWGPMAHMKHLISYQRLPFTLAYFGAMFATLYSALVLKKTFLTLIFAVFQIVTLVWYVFSYVPGGTTGLKFFSKLCASVCTKTVSKTLPV